MRKALQTGRCTLWTDAPVLQVEPGADGRVQAVLVQHAGQRRRVATRVLVMACGAVETPRMLLLARGPQAPDGLGNEQGQVGRHFMETLAWSSAGLHPQPLGSHRGLPSELVCWAFNAPDAIPGVPGGFRLSSRVGEAGFTSPASYALRALPGWGTALKRQLRDAFGRMLAIGMIGESLPNAHTYVDLDPLQRDEFGNAVARIHAHQPDTELQRLAHAAQHCRSMLAATGVPEVLEEYGSYDFFSATHVFGTCRMGTDPRQSVVDPHGRAHAWHNLYVADASVFPSSGGGESPSLTVYALALRTAAEIRQQLLARAL
jgi:choline dehydrogenase-like flavoprotein